ncbi:hypothetical protein HXX76_014542 [Chlamydomonas incerta]|uniref:Uncharacterized protein n=1 Tax=Chlamydomonas incerta TaxID=51695 RepID=A0A835VSM3_CHLIN|nr:hypothetical protein HXX76_014542 [Chlamydomonas incerta]|eukprot:KAG2424333.1 hypothetical protein HXX76_014542 [Chlamydomonas incerta]
MASAATPPASFNLPASSLQQEPGGGSSGGGLAGLAYSLLRLPAGIAQALLSPGSGEGLLGLLPGWVRQLLPGWDPGPRHARHVRQGVMVTGANSGIGFQVTRLLARNNAHVVMVVRDEDKGRKAAEDIRRDLPARPPDAAAGPTWPASREEGTAGQAGSVKRLADEFLATGSPLHVLINNAGVLAPGPFAATGDGFETTLATNYYGPLYLTLLLLPRLAASAPARVVNVASFGEAFGRVHWGDLSQQRPAELNSAWRWCPAQACSPKPTQPPAPLGCCAGPWQGAGAGPGAQHLNPCVPGAPACGRGITK